MLDSLGAEGRKMILESLIGLSLIANVSVVNVSVESGIKPAVGSASSGMPAHQKSSVMQPLVRSATECILHTVASDPRWSSSLETADVRDLIVASMPPCAEAMRAMIEAHDRLYGDGSGEVFFMGPYLDMLPVTVIKAATDSTK
jgi:hypothetical protein